MPFYLPNILLAIPRNPATAVGLPVTLGLLSGSPSSNVANSNWYFGLKTPPGTPRREIYYYAWTAMYICMGYASHVAVKALDTTDNAANHDSIQRALGLYYGQLTLNCLWSPIFFEARSPGYALIDGVLLTATTCYMTKLLDRPTNAKATYFLLPYCAWLLYDTYLNAGVWWLNRKDGDN